MKEPHMITQRRLDVADSHGWDPPQLQRALSTAHHRAARGARRLKLCAADREDLRQDMLLAMLQRSSSFDPARGAWSTFVGLVARHVVADQARRARRQSEPVFVAIDLDSFPNGSSATQLDCADEDMALALLRVADELPRQPQCILRHLGAEGDVPGAQQASGMPSATFYRAVADLRCWLRAAGLHPERHGTR
jgi:RNA polymerase sigma-70 factor (ECF subfamily)